FYGDSYVKGAADPPFELPRYLNERLDNVDVIDIGVGGYGTDQILLMFRETYSKVQRPLIIVGVFLEDVDRAILSVRTSQKPFFRMDDQQELILSGVPIVSDQDSFFSTRSLGFRSYALQALT